MYSYQFETNIWTMFQAEHQIKDPITAEQIEEYKRAKSPTKITRRDNPNGHALRRSFTSVRDRQSPQRSSFTGSPTKIEKSPVDLSPQKRRKQTSSLYDGPPAPIIGRVRGSAPHPRDGHSAVIIGDNLIIFGGDRHQMPFNDVYAYALRAEMMKLQALPE